MQNYHVDNPAAMSEGRHMINPTKESDMTTTTWMGLKDDGTQVQISHSSLMDWAHRNDKQITVGWGHSFQHKDQRLVRGEYVKEALKAGWDDLAHLLVKHLGDCPGCHIKGNNFSGCDQSAGDCTTCGK